MTVDPVAAALTIIADPVGMADKTWLYTVYMPAAKTVAAEVRRLRQELRKAQQQISDEDVCCHGVGFDQDCEDCEVAATEHEDKAARREP